MKKIVYGCFFILTILLLFGCQNGKSDSYIKIVGVDEIEVQMSTQFELETSDDVDSSEVLWILSNPKIATLEDGLFTANDFGIATITAVSKKNASIYDSKQITVVHPHVRDIIIEGESQIVIGKAAYLTATIVPDMAASEITWTSSDESIATISNGVVIGLEEGEVTIYVTCDGFTKAFLIEVISKPLEVVITGEHQMVLGTVQELKFNVDEVILSSNNEEVVQVSGDNVIATKQGSAIITAVNAEDENVTGTFEIIVNGYLNRPKSATSEELNRINEIMEQMTLEQKIGQMFMIEASSERTNAANGLPIIIDRDQGSTEQSKQYTIQEYLEGYPIGNFIINEDNMIEGSEVMVRGIKELYKMAKDTTNISPLMAFNEGDMGYHIPKGFINFPSHAGLAAIQDKDYTAQVSQLYANILQQYGINLVISPYITNDDSRYSMDPAKNALYAGITRNEYQKNDIIYSAVLGYSDGSGYQNSRNLEDLEVDEFFNLRSAIISGMPMLTIGNTYYNYFASTPIFRENPFIQDYIRDELGFDGVVFVDPTTMTNTAQFYFDTYTDIVIEAINAGVDMIGFYFNFNSWNNYRNRRILESFDEIVAAVRAGTISTERIDESVSRILLMKLRYGILDNQEPTGGFNYQEYQPLCEELEKKCFTAIGDHTTINKRQSTMVISIPSSVIYSPTVLKNFGDQFAYYFSAHGYADYKVYYSNLSNYNQILTDLENYDQIIIATSNLRVEYYGRYCLLVQSIFSTRPDALMIAFNSPADYMYIDGVKNYICLYGAYTNDFAFLMDYLNGQEEAQGKFPLDWNN